MTNKEKYINFCKIEKMIPIFSQPWWLDAVCDNGEWDAAIVEKGGQIWATMPYYIRKHYGFTQITMPKLTQTLGPYIKYPENQKYYKKLSWEKELMNDLIDQLPSYDYFMQNWHYAISNWLPFYWKGFIQTTRYTYIIRCENQEQLNDEQYETDIRRRKKKAEREGIIVCEENNLKALYNLIHATFERKNMDIPISISFIERIYKACAENNACRILFAKDKNGDYIAASMLIFDSQEVYYLLGGIDASKKDLGAMDLIQHESIKFAFSKGKHFNFEGSMVESIEKYFRSFGAVQMPYFNISRTPSRILQVYRFLRTFL